MQNHELVDAIWASKLKPIYKRILSSFTENRYYRVELRDTQGRIVNSKWRKMIYGTPQGSVFGPVLWNMFFDPLLHQLETSNWHNPMTSLNLAYIDDLILKDTDLDLKLAEHRLEEKLSIMDEFLETRSMKLSDDKLKTMCVNPDHTDPEHDINISYNGQRIEQVREYTFLGVMYDDLFSFLPHIRNLNEQINKRTQPLKMLRSASWGPTQATTMVLYQSYIESLARTGILAWYPYASWRTDRPNRYKDDLVESIEIQLRKAIRIAIGLPVQTWTRALMIESKVDSLYNIAIKTALSLYMRINPESEETRSLAKSNFSYQLKWMKRLYNYRTTAIPQTLWVGPVQVRKGRKVLLTTDRVKVDITTLKSQEAVEEVEKLYNVVVYTDASVDQDTDPPGYASIGYMWYTKKDNEWVQTKQYSARISHTHSSFSAEGVALIEALLGYPDDQVVDKVAVFTDSKSNLQTINRGVATQKEQIELFKVLSNMSSEMDIDLYHVKP